MYTKGDDYILDKISTCLYSLSMHIDYLFFLVLDDAACALRDCRKSFLIEANSLRVGTRFSSSFLPFSMRGSQ